MRNMTVLAIAGIFVCSTVLCGCGKLSSEEFEGWKNDYVEANDKAFSNLGDRASTLETGLEQQSADLSQSIGDAKDDAIAASQLGDADTIKRSEDFSKSEDAKLREELTQAANAVGESAQKFARTEDAKLHETIRDLAVQANSTAESVSSLEGGLMTAQKDLEKAMATKPMNAATVQFASGNVGLSDAAKGELNKAVTVIKGQPSAIVVVSGHADGSPVLGGRYRSNWDLSQARADSVAKYLKAQGVSNDVHTIARGHVAPVGSVKTKSGRAANRRADVTVYPPGTMPPGM